MKPLLLVGIAAVALIGCAQRENPAEVARAQAAIAAADAKATQAQQDVAAAPAPRAGNETALAAASWSSDAAGDATTALYGLPDADPLFSAHCDGTRREIVFTRAADVAVGTVDMKVGAATQIKVFEAQAVAKPMPSVTARLPASDPLVRAIVASDDAVTVQIGDGEPLLMPPSAPLRQVIANCA